VKAIAPLIAAVLFFLTGTLSAANAAAVRRPNVLFLFSDDQRADTIAALGNRHIQTPHLDQFVRGGTTFRRSYCMGAMQGAVCVPSRAMLLTGRTLFRVSANLTKEVTWPEAFAHSGYRTFITGKWHNGAPSLRRVFPQGKAVFPGGMGWPYELPLQDLKDGQLSEKRLSREHSVKVFADAAVEFIREQTAERPWLCYVAFNHPHDPRVAPPEYRAQYDERKIPLPKNFLPQHPFDISMLTGRDELLERWPRTPEAVRRHLADYYASVTHMDVQIGRILAALDATGHRDRTIIVFASDSGLAIGSHGLFGKQNIYEHSMRVPLVFNGPGIPRGKRRDAFVYLYDVLPTLGAMAGVPAPAGSEGRDLSRVIAGKERRVREEIFLAFTETQRSLRDERWKLIRYPKVDVTQLFDLRTDPDETKNLADAPHHRHRVAAILKQLGTAQQAFDDRVPLRVLDPKPAVWTPPSGEKMEEMIRKNQTR
jgi:arylsulfatase A-like enzyme